MVNGKEQKPVVLQILPELNQGGVERGTIEMANAMNDAGIKNFVASQGGRLVYNLDKIKVPHFTLSLKSKNPIKIWLNSLKLAKIIKQNGINIVHARSRAPAWSAYWAAKKTGATYITTFHGTYNLGPKKIKKFYNRVMTYGKLVIAISEHIKKHIINVYGLAEEKIRLIPRGVDVEKFSSEKVTSGRMINIAKEYNLPEDKSIILLIGRLTNWKGQKLLVEAAAKMKNRHFHCLLLGDDQGRVKYTQALKQAIKDNNLSANFSFIKHSSDVPAIMQLASIVLSASTEPEAFGRIAIEGQAMGKIVIASNIGGSLENIIDGKSGKLFENNNPQSLADTLDWALDLPEDEVKKISDAAIKNVQDNFTTKQMCDKTIAVYNELMKI